MNPSHQRSQPPPPHFLDEDARVEWDRVAPTLKILGLLTEIDMMALAAYCQAYSQWLQAMEIIREEGLLLVSEKTSVLMHNPAVSVANKSMEMMHRFMSEFGMTPSSRTRLSVTRSDNSDDEMQRLCNQ